MIVGWQLTSYLSHSLKVGNVVMRAVMGVISMQLERTDVALYQRTIDGAIAYTLELKGHQ